MKYHVNPTTMNPNKCRAKEGKCPFGADAPHFATREAALYEAEVMLTNELGSSFTEKRKAHRIRLAAEAQAALRTAVAARPQTEAKKSFEARLAEAMDSTGEKIAAWWDRNPGLAKNARRTAAAVLLAGVIAGPVGGYMAGDHVADNMNGEQTITAVQTREAQLHNYRSRGKHADTIEAKTADGDVTIRGSDVFGQNDNWHSSYGGKLISSSNEGKTITLTDITYESDNGEVHQVKDAVIEGQAKDLLQKAVETKSNNFGASTGLVAGTVAGLAAGAAGMALAMGEPTGSAYGSSGRSSIYGANNMALYVATGII